jgi:hypothetical protein
MTSAFNALFSLLLTTTLLGCMAQEPGLTDNRPPRDAKEFVRGLAAMSAVAIFDVAPSRRTACTLDVPTPPPGVMITVGWDSTENALLEPAPDDVWLPPQQPQLELPIMVTNYGRVDDPVLAFGLIGEVDLGPENERLKEAGFTGTPLGVTCNGIQHQRFQRFGGFESIEELGRDGTTLEEIKAILTDVAVHAPVIKETPLIGGYGQQVP